MTPCPQCKVGQIRDLGPKWGNEIACDHCGYAPHPPSDLVPFDHQHEMNMQKHRQDQEAEEAAAYDRYYNQGKVPTLEEFAAEYGYQPGKIPQEMIEEYKERLRYAADGGGAGGWGGDAFPGEEPQAVEDRNQRLDIDTRDAQGVEAEEYNFVYANGQLHVSDSHDHSTLAEHSGVKPEHTGPMGVGRVHVNFGKATFEIQSNVSAQGLARVLKDYCKQVGWRWGGLTDLEGEPIGTGSEFAPVKSYALSWGQDKSELEIRKVHGRFHASSALHVDDFSQRAWVYGTLGKDAFEALSEFCVDEGLTLLSGNDNVLKRHEDLEIDNNYSPEWNDEQDHHLFTDPPDERKPGGVFRCPDCALLFPTWGKYILHRKHEEGPSDAKQEDGGFPELNMDATFPPHFDEQRSEPGIHTGGYENIKPHIVDLKQEDFPSMQDDQSSFGWRRPIVWDRPSNHLIIGPTGSYHSDLYDALDLPQFRSTEGWVSVPHSEGGDDFPHGYGVHMRSNNRDELEPWISQHLTPIEPYAAEQVGDYDRDQLQEEDIWTGKVAQESLDPKDMIPGSIPFLYDIQEDQVIVGQPGTRTSDIPGKFTPGGIVEGEYEPGGQVVIRSLTNMPYSVRHLLELWTFQQPHMEIKSIHMQDDEGKRQKLAAQDIGSYLRTLAAADPAVWRVYKALTGAGGTVYVVGGAVRDAILGKEPNDLDLMVIGLPQDEVKHILAQLPGSLAATGSMGKGEDDTAHAFGVFHYREKSGHAVEVALPRREKSTGGGSKGFDKTVDHTMTPEEDLFRRDFTANAMAVNLTNGQFIDPFNGSEDVRARRLKTLHTKSFADDPLRTLRALTAMSKHGLYPTDETKAQMGQYAEQLNEVPGERHRKELMKIIEGDHPSEAIRLAQETGVLEHFLPEIARLYGHGQNNPHHELDLFDHNLNVMDRAKERKPNDPLFALAALFHDSGKLDSHWTECRDCGKWAADGHHEVCANCGSENTSGHFYHNKDLGIGQNHEDVGADILRKMMNRNRFTNDEIKRATTLVQHHMFPAFTSEKGARKFLSQVGDHAEDLLHLRWADQGGKSEYPTDPSLSIDTQMKLINQARAAKVPTNKNMLAIDGKELFNQVQLPNGPVRGQLLNHLTDQVIDNPELNTPQALLGLAQTWKQMQQPQP